MLVNNNLSESNLEALRQAILNDADFIGNSFGAFSYNCTAKQTSEKQFQYRIKFALDENQTLTIISDKHPAYVATMLVAPIVTSENIRGLYMRFPLYLKSIREAFDDYRDYQNINMITALDKKETVTDYDYLRDKVKSIYANQMMIEDRTTTVAKKNFHQLNHNLYLNTILTVINLVLVVGVLWKLFVN